MSYAVKILSPAEADVVEAALWYEAQVSGLGAEFMNKVDAAVQRLGLNPEIHQVRFADVRRAPVDRFKAYGIHYIIRASEVWVISVHHGRRHPRWLHDRRRKLGE